MMLFFVLSIPFWTLTRKTRTKEHSQEFVECTDDAIAKCCFGWTGMHAHRLRLETTFVRNGDKALDGTFWRP